MHMADEPNANLILARHFRRGPQGSASILQRSRVVSVMCFFLASDSRMFHDTRKSFVEIVEGSQF